MLIGLLVFFFFSSRRRHTRSDRDWSSDVCSSDLLRSNSATGEVAFRRNLSEDYTDVIISTTAVRGRITFDRTGTAEGNTTEIEIEGPTGTRRFTILATGKIGGLP